MSEARTLACRDPEKRMLFDLLDIGSATVWRLRRAQGIALGRDRAQARREPPLRPDARGKPRSLEFGRFQQRQRLIEAFFAFSRMFYWP